MLVKPSAPVCSHAFVLNSVSFFCVLRAVTSRSRYGVCEICVFAVVCFGRGTLLLPVRLLCSSRRLGEMAISAEMAVAGEPLIEVCVGDANDFAISAVDSNACLLAGS